MLGKDSNAIRPWLPGIAVLLAYVIFIAVPLHRERMRTIHALRKQVAVAEQLSIRLKSEPELSVSANGIDASGIDANEIDATTLLSQPVSMTSNDLPAEGSNRTNVQTFNQLLAIFQTNGLDFVSAIADRVDQPRAQDTVMHRVTLTGSFSNLLSALKSIETSIPNAATTEVIMERPSPSETCNWELGFRFSEGIQ